LLVFLKFSVEVTRKDDNWAKKCMEYEVEGPRPARGRPKRTWREVVEKDCQAHKLNKEDAVPIWILLSSNASLMVIRAFDVQVALCDFCTLAHAFTVTSL